MLLTVSKSFLNAELERLFLDFGRASGGGSEEGSGGRDGSDGGLVGTLPGRPGAMLLLQRIDR